MRGVNSDSAVATLLARGLVTEVGRRETVGRPALLAVTPECLQYLGLRSLSELPPLPDSRLNRICILSRPRGSCARGVCLHTALRGSVTL